MMKGYVIRYVRDSLNYNINNLIRNHRIAL